jgi:hypothetical protein
MDGLLRLWESPNPRWRRAMETAPLPHGEATEIAEALSLGPNGRHIVAECWNDPLFREEFWLQQGRTATLLARLSLDERALRRFPDPQLAEDDPATKRRRKRQWAKWRRKHMPGLKRPE